MHRRQAGPLPAVWTVWACASVAASGSASASSSAWRTAPPRRPTSTSAGVSANPAGRPHTPRRGSRARAAARSAGDRRIRRLVIEHPDIQTRRSAGRPSVAGPSDPVHPSEVLPWRIGGSSTRGRSRGAPRQGRRCGRGPGSHPGSPRDGGARTWTAPGRRRGVGDEQVGLVADPVPDRVLEQPVGDGDRRAEQVAAGADGLAHRVTAMEDHLEVEVGHGRAGDADVIVGRDGPRAAVDERPVHRADRLEDPVAVAVEAGRRGGREDRVALELDQAEVGLHALDDRVEQRGQDRVGGRDAVTEVDPVLVSTPAMKPV